MHVALISTPCVKVPPDGYGGTELVVQELAEGLVARGHLVSLVATSDSSSSAEVIHDGRPACWPPRPLDELQHAAFAARWLAGPEGATVDVVHANTPSLVALCGLFPQPVVYTVHHGPDPDLWSFYERHPEVTFICISERQRQLMPALSRSVVIHHGLERSRYPIGPGGEDLLFLGRFSREKGLHLAIDVALASKRRLLVAGRVHESDEVYFEKEVAPRVQQAGDLVRFVGEADATRKVQLLQKARALLCPVQWEEPFGLAYLEAMLCGTPVLAFRRGSLPELVRPGVTGYLCRDLQDMVEAVPRIASLDRRACRRAAVATFDAPQMVASYEAAYRSTAGLQHLEPRAQQIWQEARSSI